MYEYIFPDLVDYENNTIKFEVRYKDATWKFLNGTDQVLREQEWESDRKSVVYGFPSWFHVAFTGNATDEFDTNGRQHMNKLIFTINRKAVKDEDSGPHDFKVRLYDDASGGFMGGRQYTIPFDLNVVSNENEGPFKFYEFLAYINDECSPMAILTSFKIKCEHVENKGEHRYRDICEDITKHSFYLADVNTLKQYNLMSFMKARRYREDQLNSMPVVNEVLIKINQGELADRLEKVA